MTKALVYRKIRIVWQVGFSQHVAVVRHPPSKQVTQEDSTNRAAALHLFLAWNFPEIPEPYTFNRGFYGLIKKNKIFNMV